MRVPVLLGVVVLAAASGAASAQSFAMVEAERIVAEHMALAGLPADTTAGMTACYMIHMSEMDAASFVAAEGNPDALNAASENMAAFETVLDCIEGAL